MNKFQTSQERTTIYGTAKIKLPNSRRSKLIHALNEIDDAVLVENYDNAEQMFQDELDEAGIDVALEVAAEES